MRTKLNENKLKWIAIALYSIALIGVVVLIWSAIEYFIEIKRIHDLQTYADEHIALKIDVHAIWTRWINFGENGYSPFVIMLTTMIALPLFALVTTWVVNKLNVISRKRTITFLLITFAIELIVIIVWVVMAFV